MCFFLSEQYFKHMPYHTPTKIIEFNQFSSPISFRINLVPICNDMFSKVVNESNSSSTTRA